MRIHEIIAVTPAQDILAEKWIATIDGDGERDTVDVFQNPSRRELLGILKDAKKKALENGYSGDVSLRGYLTDRNLFVWDADATHGSVSSGLKAAGIFIGSPALNIHLAHDAPFLEHGNWMVEDQDELAKVREFVKQNAIMTRLYGSGVELDVRQSY